MPWAGSGSDPVARSTGVSGVWGVWWQMGAGSCQGEAFFFFFFLLKMQTPRKASGVLQTLWGNSHLFFIRNGNFHVTTEHLGSGLPAPREGEEEEEESHQCCSQRSWSRIQIFPGLLALVCPMLFYTSEEGRVSWSTAPGAAEQALPLLVAHHELLNLPQGWLTSSQLTDICTRGGPEAPGVVPVGPCGPYGPRGP